MDSYTVQFSLHQGAQRLTIAARDLSRSRLETIFKVEPDSIYLQDDITRETFFPDHNGHFDTTLMRDRGSFSVSGTRKEDLAGSTSFPSTSTLNFRPRISSVTPPTNLQNPTRKPKSVRRPIYVAEVDHSGKVSECTTVHVTISEGEGVQVVGQSVQEFLNSDDNYTVCDKKGIAFPDTPETRGLEFWKIPTRKLYAIRTEDLAKTTPGRFDATTKRKRMDPGDNEVLDSLQDVELEVKKSSARVSEELEEKFEELSISISSINSTILQIMQQCDILDEVKEKVCQLSQSIDINTCLRQALVCKMCRNIPTTLLAITACCGQVAGCGPCMQMYLNDNDTCVMCQVPMFASKLVYVRFLGDVLALLK